MEPWIWALVVVVVIVVALLAASVASRRRTRSLREQFGPEYNRTVAAADGRRKAEARLQERTKQHARLHIVPLSEPARLEYGDRWREVQQRFVDQPSGAVTEAEELLTQVMHARGYPVDDFEQQADLVSVDHPEVVENYRVAHQLGQKGGRTSTEDLREALLRYRSLFDELLRPDSPEDGADTGDTGDPERSSEEQR